MEKLIRMLSELSAEFAAQPETWKQMAITKAISTIEAQRQESEQLQAQVARMRNFLIETNSSSCSYCGCGNGNHGYDCELKEALSDTPAEYHNPADVAALKQAVADMKLIAGDVISEKNCYICEYYVDGQGCMLDGTQFNDDGECHFTWRGENAIDKIGGKEDV